MNLIKEVTELREIVKKLQDQINGNIDRIEEIKEENEKLIERNFGQIVEEFEDKIIRSEKVLTTMIEARINKERCWLLSNLQLLPANKNSLFYENLEPDVNYITGQKNLK